jgi:hypothetical protein
MFCFLNYFLILQSCPYFKTDNGKESYHDINLEKGSEIIKTVGEILQDHAQASSCPTCPWIVSANCIFKQENNEFFTLPSVVA